MRIDSSTIGMESTRTYKSVTQRSRIGVHGTYAGGAGGLNAFLMTNWVQEKMRQEKESSRQICKTSQRI